MFSNSIFSICSISFSYSNINFDSSISSSTSLAHVLQEFLIFQNTLQNTPSRYINVENATMSFYFVKSLTNECQAGRWGAYLNFLAPTLCLCCKDQENSERTGAHIVYSLKVCFVLSICIMKYEIMK